MDIFKHQIHNLQVVQEPGPGLQEAGRVSFVAFKFGCPVPGSVLVESVAVCADGGGGRQCGGVWEGLLGKVITVQFGAGFNWHPGGGVEYIMCVTDKLVQCIFINISLLVFLDGLGMLRQVAWRLGHHMSAMACDDECFWQLQRCVGCDQFALLQQGPVIKRYGTVFEAKSVIQSFKF